MALISDQIYKLETPQSESDSNYAEFEFLLAWYGRSGEYLNYLFTDWNLATDVQASVINRTKEQILSNVIATENRTVRLVAEDLSLNDLTILSSVIVAKEIKRIYKDGTTENVGVDRNSYDYRQTDGRYNFEFDIILFEKPLPK